jgi:ABC-type transport system involved in multi-copper enzyme maturation permease subunit
MNATVATQMAGADFLKLRKKRGTLIWALVLALAPLLIFFIVRAVQHSSNPLKYEVAGGTHGYTDAVRLLTMFFGPLAAILIGTESGAGDAASGVFRDLVVTGRSRVGLFASRVPAALGLCWLVVLVGYGLTVLGTYAFAGSSATPEGALLLNGLGFSLLATGVVCVVAVGFASLTASRPAALTALIGWHLVASPILANISSLGGARRLILSQAVAHFSPVDLGDRGGHGTTVTMSGAVGVIVLAGWLVAFLALGAWRTRTMDA